MNLLRAETLAWWWRSSTRFVGAAAVAAAAGGFAISRAAGNTGDLDSAFRSGLQGIGVVGVLLCAFLGAATVGGEQRSGALATLLTWEPRRHRVIAGQLLAVALGAAVLVVLVVVVAAFAAAITAAAWGQPAPVSALISNTHPTLAWRIVCACALAATLGAAWTMVSRSSAATMVAILVLFVIGEPVVNAIWQGTIGWLPIHSLLRLGTPADQYFAPVSAAAAGIRSLGWVLVSGTAAAALFARREVR